jgi:transposase
VDVSQDWLDFHIRPQGIAGRHDNDPAGIAALADLCLSQGVELVAMEASGSHERRAYALLWQAGLACGLANARQVRLYAASMGFLEKTDRIDAAMIAAFAEARKIAPKPIMPARQVRLSALVARLRQVTGDLTIQKQRRHVAMDEEMGASLDEVIVLLIRQSRKLEGEIASLIDDDPLWSALDQAFRSIKGVAGRTVAHLMAGVPEIGLISNKAIAKLVGLAPIADDSGKRAGARSIKGGRSGPRSILYLVAAIAARYDPHLAAFQQRLQAAQKAKMVIRIALARKLLVILNAKARDARKAFANAA